MLLTKTSYALVLLSSLSPLASGHITLHSPNGGEVLIANSTFIIEWEIRIPHNLENWDIAYNRDIGNAEWITIIEDLEAGDPSQGAQHQYAWTVPDIIDDTVWVRVIMDNDTADYQDGSQNPFSIIPAPGSIAIGVGACLTGARRRRIS